MSITHRPFWFIIGIVLFILAVSLYLGNPTPARAAGSPNGSGSSSANVTLGILPGPLTATMNSISLVGEAPNGTYTTITYLLHMSVSDETGSGSGWNLALAGALPSSTAMLTRVTVACASNSTCSLPQSSVTYPVMMQGTNSVLSAGANSGMGTIDITATVAVTTPVSANASSSALSLMISNGTI